MYENTYLKSVLYQVPRILTQLNRNRYSNSYGSFDRNFWHFKTNDISCARFQEAGKVLALLYVTKFKDNIYYQNDQSLKHVKARVLQHWAFHKEIHESIKSHLLVLF